jgi:hypothetical protein
MFVSDDFQMYKWRDDLYGPWNQYYRFRRASHLAAHHLTTLSDARVLLQCYDKDKFFS